MKDLDYISEFHDQFNRDNIIFAYDGVLTKDIVSAFLSRLKIDIERTKVPKKEKKRFFSMVVECIQNLSKHGHVIDESKEHFLILVENDNNLLKISTGNVINKTNQDTIQTLITNVNAKNKLELQQMYQYGIANNELTEKGEANLGLIDIARKSSEKLKYKFKSIDERTSFFIFQSQIQIMN